MSRSQTIKRHASNISINETLDVCLHKVSTLLPHSGYKCMNFLLFTIKIYHTLEILVALVQKLILDDCRVPVPAKLLSKKLCDLICDVNMI